MLGEANSTESGDRSKRYLPPEWDKIHLLTGCERREKVWGGIPKSKNEACGEGISGRLFLLRSDRDN